MTRRLGLGLRQKSPLVCADILWPALVVVWRASVLTLRYAAGRKVSSFVHPRSPRQRSRITESIFVYSTSVLLSTSVSKSCYYHIRQLRCIRPHLDSKTASTIATSIVHSKPDMKEWGVMVDESGELIEPTEEVPLKKLGESQLERLVRGWRREAGSWFQRRGKHTERNDLLFVDKVM